MKDATELLEQIYNFRKDEIIKLTENESVLSEWFAQNSYFWAKSEEDYPEKSEKRRTINLDNCQELDIMTTILGYKSHRIDISPGLYVYAFEPLDPQKPVHVVARGTDPDLKDLSVYANLDPDGPAHNMISRHKQEIINSIKGICQKSRSHQIVFAGHSLGGSIIQQVNAHLLEYLAENNELGISSITLNTLQSAGVNPNVAERAKLAATKLAGSIQLTVNHYHNKGDPAPYTGHHLLYDVSQDIADVNLHVITDYGYNWWKDFLTATIPTTPMHIASMFVFGAGGFASGGFMGIAPRIMASLFGASFGSGIVGYLPSMFKIHITPTFVQTDRREIDGRRVAVGFKLRDKPIKYKTISNDTPENLVLLSNYLSLDYFHGPWFKQILGFVHSKLSGQIDRAAINTTKSKNITHGYNKKSMLDTFQDACKSAGSYGKNALNMICNLPGFSNANAAVDLAVSISLKSAIREGMEAAFVAWLLSTTTKLLDPSLSTSFSNILSTSLSNSNQLQLDAADNYANTINPLLVERIAGGMPSFEVMTELVELLADIVKSPDEYSNEFSAISKAMVCSAASLVWSERTKSEALEAWDNLDPIAKKTEWEFLPEQTKKQFVDSGNTNDKKFNAVRRKS